MLLAVDTSTRVIGVALYDGIRVLSESSWYSKNHHTIELAPTVKTALDSVGADEIGLSAGPKDRWKNSDGGMHVFANALYQVMMEENFNKNGELFSDFLIRMIAKGKFESGSIEERFDAIKP